MEKKKDFTADIEQVKQDLQQIETSILIAKARLEEMQRHKETLDYFLETIDYD
jgi:hypothetical protein